MTIGEALADARAKLKRLETPDLDAEVLLAHVLKKPREFALTRPEQSLHDEQARAFDGLVARRAEREPVAYLIREKKFYGRRFYVDERVHIPKPSTEDLIDAIKRELPKQFDGVIADIGTGSGCIAVTLALEFPSARIIATDISDEALAVAEKNAEHHGRIEAASPPQATRPLMERIAFLIGSLGEPLHEPVDIIAANLPYGWRKGWTDDEEVVFQPEISYLGGADSDHPLTPSLIKEGESGGRDALGLDAIAALMRQLHALLNKNGRAFLEFDPRQTERIKKLAAQCGVRCAIIKDLSGFDRVVRLTN
ncbi:MAG: HemK/PrmC family methyltransferase [Patescibacteria group bacterium]